MRANRAARRRQSDAPRAVAAPPFARRLALLIVVSGAAALVYQSLWMRRLSLILGSTTYALGTVLAAFMAGLGVGAWALGRRADRTSTPLRLYGALEVAIGVLGIASPLVLAQGGPVYAFFYARLHAHPALLTLARFAIGFGFVAVPAFLMGGTLPVATCYVVRHAAAMGAGIGRLYALNTLGAALGVLLLPFVLLPTLGVRWTLWACGLLNVAIGLVALAGARQEQPTGGDVTGMRPPAMPAVLAAFFLSGFVALALEVAWNRFFIIYVGSSIYSYAVILFLYLTGVAAGGLVFAWLDRRGHDPRRVFVACLGLMLAALAATIPLMDRIVYLQLWTLDAIGLGFVPFQLATLVAAGLVVLPPTILLGVSFPAVATAVTPAVERVGSDLGLAYLVNTAGTTVGALATSFVLLPFLGLRGTLDLLAAIAAVALVVAATPRRRIVGALGAGLLALVPALAPRWDARLMHTTISKEPGVVLDIWRAGRLEEDVVDANVRELRDGVDATVSVVDRRGIRSLFVNGKPDASDGKDMTTQAVLAHLPLLAHPAPRRVLVIGMGSGASASAAARHPVEAIDLVEISSDVVELAGRWFKDMNRDVLHDPRVRLHLEDGRNFVAFAGGEPYDVIVSEPSNPWMTGVANLFTDEFFAQVRGRLRPDGILAQWFHYYSMDIEEVRSLLGALRGHFAHVYVFAFLAEWVLGDMMVLASAQPLDFTTPLTVLASDDARGAELRGFGIGPAELLQSFVFSADNVDRFVAGAPLNSDDRPVIELHAPRAVFRDTLGPNLEAMHRASAGARLPMWGGRAFAGGFAVEAPDGFHRTSSAFRNELVPPAPGETRPLRAVLTEVAFADDAGGRLVVLAARGDLGADGLALMAAQAAAGPVAASGELTVGGHRARTYEASPHGRAAVWMCPESNTSYAAYLTARDGVPADEVVRSIACHGG